MFIFRMYNNIDFNLIIFFYNSLRSVIYIANSIEIFFGSVQYYMGFRYCNGGLKYCAGRDISVNSTIQPVIYKNISATRSCQLRQP